MEIVAPALKLVHVAIAMVFVAGLIGRWALLTRAARQDEVELAHRFADAAGPFERMVVVGSGLVLVAGFLTAWAQGYPWLGLTTGWILASVILLVPGVAIVPLVFIPRGRVFEAEMSSARAAGAITPGLRAAFADPAVTLARRYEVASVALVVALMVLKPF